MKARFRRLSVFSAELFIARLENLPFSFPLLAVYFVILLSLRELFEQLFFETSFNIYRFDHHVFFFFPALLGGILGISWIGKTDMAKTARVVASGYVLIVLPPLIDHFLFLRNQPYEYILPKEFAKNFLTLFLFTPKAGFGIFSEIVMIMVLASAYVFLRSRSVPRALLTALFLYLLAGFLATPRLFLPLPSMTDPVVWQSRHVLYFCYNLILSIIVGALFLWRVHPALPKSVFREIWSFRTLHFLAMAGAGLYSRKFFYVFAFPDVLGVFLTFTLMGLIWTVTVLINNVSDLAIDRVTNPGRPLARQDIEPSFYLHLGLILAIVAAFVSLVLGTIALAITIVSLASAIVYSVPPFRLRLRLFSNAFIAWGSVLGFYLGYFAAAPLLSPPVSGNTVRLSLVIFLALFFGSFSKDIKDYQGDLRCGIKTMVTVLGLPKGQRIISAFLFLSLLTPLLIFHKTMDVIFMAVTAAGISLLFYGKGKIGISFAGYILVFLYCLGRVFLS
jgi:4-hydroxybenzoate polyprenyltransferase